MNNLDKLIERKAFELFTAQGWDAKTVQFKIRELQICIFHGYNSRAEIFSLIKKAAEAC